MAEHAPPRALVGAVAASGVRQVVKLALGPAFAAAVRARKRQLHRHVPTLAHALRRHYLLTVVGLVPFAVVTVFLLRGARWAWWLRVAANVFSLVVLAVALPRFFTGADAVLGAVVVVETALLLAPSTRRYALGQSPPR